MNKGIALLKSKTFYFNVLVGIVAVASLFGFGEFEPDPKVAESIGAISAIINIMLRLYTSKPITKVI